ncbi:MAG TPA: hypothetical protein VLB27_06210, partial [candidate division Zixibacteria bacterium]|nr:hypothetical protein [candidate division Zixibacteria bacterium]
FHIVNIVYTHGNPVYGLSVIPRYFGFDPSGFSIEDGPVEYCGWQFPFSYYVTLDQVSDGTVVSACHENVLFPSGIFRARVAHNSVPGLPDFIDPYIPDSVWSPFASGIPGSHEGGAFVWPQIADTDNGAEQVTHLLISQWRGGGDELQQDTLNQILYTRRVGATGDAWSLGMPLGETRQYRSAVIAAARNSSRVGIAWIGPRGDGTVSGAPIPRFDTLAGSEFDSDVYVMVSEDAGVTWGPRTNLTQRADSLPGGFAPQAKMSVAFDDNGDFHVVWQAVRWRGYGESTGKSGRMYHWSEVTGGVSLAVDGVYENTQCGSGYNQLNIDNPQLSTCDGKLYLTYSEFASPWHGAADDCAERAQFGNGFAAANGEIYLAISADNGATWDDPRNLTATYTPNCDTIPGGVNPDCDSDAWHSTTRVGIDITGGVWGPVPDLSSNLGGYGGVNYLFVSYINDADPGAAILAEGGWTINQVNVFRFGCVEAVSGPVLASSLPQLIPDTDTLFIPSADTALSWVLQNIGSADITDLSVTLNSVNPPGHMTLSGFGTALPAGSNNADTGVITLNAALASELAGASAEIVVDGSFPSAPRSYTVSYVVATPPPPPCCAVAGDFDHSGAFNIADVTSGIGYIFSGGPGPVCCEEADFNADGSFNISDVTFGIAYIFLGDLPLPCPPEGSVCGL